MGTAVIRPPMLALLLTSCGGELPMPVAYTVCGAEAFECQHAGMNRHPRACVLRPSGAIVYADDVHDSWLIDQLKRRGVWSTGATLEGSDCE